MTRPDASAERMLSVAKRDGLSVLPVLGAPLLTHLINPDTLVAQLFLLAIGRSIIETHGGRPWTTTNPTHGATFQFTLPANNGNQPD